MRDLRVLEQYRLPGHFPHGGPGDSHGGVFVLTSKSTGRELRIIASNGDGWDHVSVSLENRCPNWQEMEQVKRTFFKDDEIAMQLHLPPSQHISIHPFVLHIWRPHHMEVPTPPVDMV